MQGGGCVEGRSSGSEQIIGSFIGLLKGSLSVSVSVSMHCDLPERGIVGEGDFNSSSLFSLFLTCFLLPFRRASVAVEPELTW